VWHRLAPGMRNVSVGYRWQNIGLHHSILKVQQLNKRLFRSHQYVLGEVTNINASAEHHRRIIEPLCRGRSALTAMAITCVNQLG
jgi:hypothetical protein